MNSPLFSQIVEILTYADQTWLDPLAKRLLNFHPQFPVNAAPESSLDGSWHLTPRQHVIEYAIYNLTFAILFFSMLKRILTKGSQIDKALKSFKPRSSLSLGEVLALFATLSSVSLRAIHLYNRGPANVIFLLQPCHLYAFTLCTLPLLPQRSFLPHFLFNVMIYILWGAMLAVIFPDLRDYAQLFELENFWIEHALVLILPIYFVVTKKYQLFPFSLSFAFTSWVAFALYHSAILCTAALTVGKNLNYMLAPPPGPLEYFGDAYRAVMFTFCIFLTAIFGGIYTTICRLALELFSKFGSPKKTPQKLKSSKKAN